MKCYYEELGVPRDANDADIKTAYRKLALRWHPDKNPDALDEAKERFQLIQQAYEVLSDSQERAWYDNHRDQILRGKNSEYTENCLDVFEYFTSSCFRGYGDDEKGFYAIYRGVFEKIAAEDAEFMDDEDEVEQIPTFGDSNSSYEDVVAPFYAYWQAYCTKKTYTWLCPYNVKEIRDRRVLREVEKEMKKIGQKARKDRNEEVRNLVSFIRKRDKRVQAYRKMLEERAEANRKKQEQNRLEQIRKRQREVAEMRQNHKQNNQSNDEYEALLKQLAQDYSDSSAEEDSETYDEEEEGDEYEVLESGEEAYYVDDIYCVACNKSFKNEGAYANHESSKKHREAKERMKLEMQAEEEAFQDQDKADDAEEEKRKEMLDSGAEVEIVEKDVQELSKEIDQAANASVTPEKDEASEQEEPASRIAKRNKKARKNAKLNKSQIPKENDEHEETVAADFLAQAKIDDSDEEDWNSSSKKSARKNKNKKHGKKTIIEEEKTNSAKQETKVTEKKEQQQQQNVTNLQKEADEVNETVDADASVKKSQPKAKPKEVEESTAISLVCVTCKANFPSKNKLFNHLKITNHGVFIPKAKTVADAGTAEGKSKKGKGKKK